MPIYRRAIALLTGVLMLQLTLLGSVAPCMGVAGAASGSSGTARHPDMGDMDMAAMDPSGASITDESEAPPGPAPSAPEPPCSDSLPSRGCDTRLDVSDCAAMIACTHTTIGVMADVSPVPAARSGDALIRGVTLPGLNRSTAPESPPPRA